MQREAFFGIQATHNPHRWYLPLVPELCTGHGFLFGGCGLGACIEALEGTTGRPLIWATGQYLSYARPPSVMDIDVAVPVEGRAITQARAVARVGDTEILTVNAALGHRDVDLDGTFATMPEMPTPDQCPHRAFRNHHARSIQSRIELRMADASEVDFDAGRIADGEPRRDGRSALWARIEDLPETTAAKLGVLGDYVPFGTSQAFGQPVGGNSLDNTLRVVRLVPTEWVLLDIHFQALDNGFGHGQVLLWATDGTLLAIASQSTIARFWDR